VFRDGSHIRSAPTPDWTKQSMVAAMLGEAATERLGLALVEGVAAEAGEDAPAAPAAAPVLEVRGLSVPGLLEDVSFEVRQGEILGIAGLVGAGRTELLKSLAGNLKISAGELFVDGKPVRWPQRVRQALKLGIALLPEERKTEGLMLEMSVWDNVVTTDLWGVSRFGFLDQRRAKVRSSSLLDAVGFRGSPERTARALSGGNQQKVVIAKWLHRLPRVFLLDEPTRGIDVGAKAEILETLHRLTAQGLSIVVVSSEFEEIVAVSDRVVLLANGRVIGELEKPAITVHEILHRLFDVESEPTESEGDRSV
jgi:ABC-type sugar transport system ATPase subunit